jgi:hypothetical protein
MPYQPFHHTVVATDVVGSSDRDDQLQLKMRADLREILAETLAQQGLDMTALGVTDLGDGIRLQVPAVVSPSAILTPFIPNLATVLRLHRKASNEKSRVRLRVAIHMGLLHRERAGGWAGTVLTECARLLDAPSARDLIAASGADLVVVVSQPIYEAVVRPGFGLDPGSFDRIRVRSKETDTHAWAWLPGSDRAVPIVTPKHQESAGTTGSDERPTTGGTTGRGPTQIGGVRTGPMSAVFLAGDSHLRRGAESDQHGV